MIQREWKPATLLTYDGSVDEYGQLRQGTPAETQIRVVLKPYIHTETDDIRFQDVQFLALTDVRGITDQNALEMDGVLYQITYVLPGRYDQLFLRRQG